MTYARGGARYKSEGPLGSGGTSTPVGFSDSSAGDADEPDYRRVGPSGKGPALACGLLRVLLTSMSLQLTPCRSQQFNRDLIEVAEFSFGGCQRAIVASIRGAVVLKGSKLVEYRRELVE